MKFIISIITPLASTFPQAALIPQALKNVGECIGTGIHADLREVHTFTAEADRELTENELSIMRGTIEGCIPNSEVTIEQCTGSIEITLPKEPGATEGTGSSPGNNAAPLPIPTGQPCLAPKHPTEYSPIPEVIVVPPIPEVPDAELPDIDAPKI